MPAHLVDVLLVVCSFLFALNMGGTGFTPSFSAALGAKLIKRGPAVLLFAVFVGIGSVAIGSHVAKTLGTGFVPPESIDRLTALVLITAATLTLFVANIVKIPQSTSWVTVFS